MTHTHSQALEQAAACDQAGNHDEAVNVLARAVTTGDLVAMTVLGKRLLVGDRAPYLPKEGAGMVLEAAQKGVAEAVAQVAVMQCTGVFQQKNWQHALNSLTWAARLGWQPAREQLLLFSGISFSDDQDELLAREETYWQALGESLEAETLMSVPPVHELNRSPRVCEAEGFLDEVFCRLLIRQSANRLEPALVYDPVNRRNIRSQTRTNSIAKFNLVENEFMHFLLQERMSRVTGEPMEQMEATSILHYHPGEEISNHYDFVDPDLPDYEQEIADNGQRIITFLIYLNDDYSGGETAFPKLGISHRGKLGEALYFINSLADGSPDLRTQHAGCPPTSGEKWIVSQFIRNRPVKYVL